MTQLIGAKEVANRLQVPVSWVRKWTREGRIHSVRLGKYVRYKTDDLEQFILERENTDAEACQ